MKEEHPEMPLFFNNNAKGHEGEPLFSQWRVATDAFEQMINFLELEPGRCLFTESDRDAITAGLERLAACIGQMDAGQRGKKSTVSFDEIPHIMTRVCVGAMRMKLSGALDRLECDEVVA